MQLLIAGPVNAKTGRRVALEGNFLWLADSAAFTGVAGCDLCEHRPSAARTVREFWSEGGQGIRYGQDESDSSEGSFHRHVRGLLSQGRARVIAPFEYSVLRADSAPVKSTEEMLDLPGVLTLLDGERCRRSSEAVRSGHVQTSSNDASVFSS
jgi:hypothetical protein